MTKFKFAVGDRVKALVKDFPSHEGKPLVVMFVDEALPHVENGYGVGVVGGNPVLAHSHGGWLYYTEDEIEAIGN